MNDENELDTMITMLYTVFDFLVKGKDRYRDTYIKIDIDE